MKLLKKTVAAVISASMLFAMTTCSKIEQNYKREGAEWAIEAYKMLPAEFNEDTCNKFYMGGDVYEFPMKAGEFFDNGWEIIDIYQEDVDENYPLDPGFMYEFCLDKNHDVAAMVWIFNDSDKAMPVSECTVIYFCIDWNEEALLPGGALLKAKYDSLEEGLAAYNEDMTEFDEEDMVYGYEFDVDGWNDNCSVRLDFGEDQRGFTISTVKYYAVDPEILELAKDSL